MIFALLASGLGHAFCGNYVGQAGATLTNGASQVAIVRQGRRTSITMANDVDASVSEFAVLVPIPVVLGPDDVRVVDPKVFERLDLYSGPRLVSYTCEELYPDVNRVPSVSLGCADYAVMTKEDALGGVADTDVDVAARFITGEYEIVILDAQTSAGLFDWLDDNGYAIEPFAESMVQEYLDAGSYFFVARVNTELMAPDQSMLSPLSFSYESDAFSLPIRLGTANSAGVQDLVAYIVTDPEAGRVGIANYEERTVEDECLMMGDDLGQFYNDLVEDGDTGPEATWITEYGWNVSPYVAMCDPCPPTETQVPMPTADLVALGFDVGEGVDTGSFDSWSGGFGASYYFTRLHMRYTPEQATQDISFYTSGITDDTQQRYVQYEPYLEDAFPICGVGWSEDPGSCKDESAEMRRRVRHWQRKTDPGSGCDAGSAAGGLMAAALSGLLLRRRAR